MEKLMEFTVQLRIRSVTTITSAIDVLQGEPWLQQLSLPP